MHLHSKITTLAVLCSAIILAGCGNMASNATESTSLESGSEVIASGSELASYSDDIQEGVPMKFEMIDNTGTLTKKQKETYHEELDNFTKEFFKNVFTFHNDTKEEEYEANVTSMFSYDGTEGDISIHTEDNLYQIFSGVHMDSTYKNAQIQALFFNDETPTIVADGYVTAEFSNDRVDKGTYDTPFVIAAQKTGGTWKLLFLSMENSYKEEGFYEYFKEGSDRRIVSYAGDTVIDWFRFRDVESFLVDGTNTGKSGLVVTTKDGKEFSGENALQHAQEQGAVVSASTEEENVTSGSGE